MTISNKGRGKKTVIFRTFLLNCGWVWVKSPKLFSEKNNVKFIWLIGPF